MPSKVQWSYLAGIIDGEGCISCFKAWIVQRNKKNLQRPANEQRFYWQYQFTVTITNTDLSLMKWLVVTFGGSYRGTYATTEKHKGRYEWSPKGQGHHKKILLGILPYILMKRKQAILGLKYIDLEYGKQKEREDIFQQMKILNQKGPSPTTNMLNLSEESILEEKIESELHGDMQSDLTVT
jgi:hypothetical protein